MLSALTALVLSFLTTLLGTPLVRAWAVRKGVVDSPGGRRVHRQVTPRLGGVSVILGFYAPLALFAVIHTGMMQDFMKQPNLVLGLVLGSAVVGAVGAADDIRGLGPWPKLAAQALAASIAYGFGYRIDIINIPFLGDIQLGALGPLVTVFWFLAITNAINLIDGLDGLAAGIAFFAVSTNLVIAYLKGSWLVVLLSTSLAGSLLGFLRYNFNPATIFLGDAGSMFLGFALAATSITGATTKSSTAVTILVPIISLGIPIVDTLLAMVRRTLAHQSIFSADRAHIHHRLLDLGITHRRVVLLLYMGSILLAAAALGISFGRSYQLGGALIVAGVVLGSLVRASSQLQRAGRPITSPAERELALKALDSRVQRTVRELSTCLGRPAEIERCLSELAADKRLLQSVKLCVRGSEEPADIVLELRFTPYELAITMSEATRGFIVELRQVFRALAEATDVSLRSNEAGTAQTDLATAE